MTICIARISESNMLYIDVIKRSLLIFEVTQQVSSRHIEGAAERGLSKPDQPVSK